MRPILFLRWVLPVFCLGMALLVSCAQPTPAPLPSITPTPAAMDWYQTPTPSRTPVPPTPVRRVTVPPPPTPTPFYHTIVKGDTLGAIAYQYGVTVEDLVVANPGIDPGFLSIDATLIIPMGDESPATAPTVTPIPVETGSPDCYNTASGGAWCFLLAANPFDFAVENLSAWISLYDAGGANFASQPAIAPLNLLPAGKAMPLMAYFEPPLPETFSAQAEILSALPAAQVESRYLLANVVLENLEMAPSNKQAAAAGWVELPVAGLVPRQVWLAAVAYGENGEVVGVRKWEAGEGACAGWPTPTSTVTPGLLPTATVEMTPTAARTEMAKCVEFEVEVSSLGPPIQQVELLVEARP